MLQEYHKPIIGYLFWYLMRTGNMADAVIRLEADKKFPTLTQQELSEVMAAARERKRLTEIAVKFYPPPKEQRNVT